MRSALAALAILLLAACTANEPHRLTPQGKAVEARVHPGDLSTEEGRQRIEPSALEVISGHSGFFTRPVTDIIRGLTAQMVMQNLSLRRPA
jgi:hypothetical protein